MEVASDRMLKRRPWQRRPSSDAECTCHEMDLTAAKLLCQPNRRRHWTVQARGRLDTDVREMHPEPESQAPVVGSLEKTGTYVWCTLHQEDLKRPLAFVAEHTCHNSCIKSVCHHLKENVLSRYKCRPRGHAESLTRHHLKSVSSLIHSTKASSVENHTQHEACTQHLTTYQTASATGSRPRNEHFGHVHLIPSNTRLNGRALWNWD